MKAITYIDGEWVEGNPKVLGVMDQPFWFATTVFDGARAFAGLAPDLDRHCARALRSARHMGLAPTQTAEALIEIALAGCAHFPPGAELYIRPIFFPGGGFLYPDPDSARFMLCVHEEPLPPPTGFSACLARFRRPLPESAPTLAKAACLYPTSGMAVKEATEKGFDNTVMLDPLGHVAEFATSNLWIVKDGVAATPAWNGTFLNGITRQRVIALLREDGVRVEERCIGFAEVAAADEVFSTGNFAKVKPVTRIEDRELQPGPVFARARELYFRFAEETPFRVPQ